MDVEQIKKRAALLVYHLYGATPHGEETIVEAREKIAAAAIAEALDAELAGKS